jgi:hypothetical protein
MFDQNNRAPLGPEFNPTTTNGDLIRPEVSFSEISLANWLSLILLCVLRIIFGPSPF